MDPGGHCIFEFESCDDSASTKMDADVPLHPEELLQADESTEGKRLRVKNQVHVCGLGTGESSRLAQGMWTLRLFNERESQDVTDDTWWCASEFPIRMSS